jgi:PIN domain nuclease of toxin-antitoxin system
MPMLNLDTHILVHALSGDLRKDERELLAENNWGISAIVFWELAKLVHLGRLELDLADRDVRSALNQLHIWPIDIAVATQSTRMDFKGDPADELIAATSVVHAVPLLTRDRVILGSRMVPLVS